MKAEKNMVVIIWHIDNSFHFETYCGFKWAFKLAFGLRVIDVTFISHAKKLIANNVSILGHHESYSIKLSLIE